LALAQAVVYLGTAPNINAFYEAYSRVQEDVQKTDNDPVPLQIRNTSTQLIKDLGNARVQYSLQQKRGASDG
jgi:putative ATPase